MSEPGKLKAMISSTAVDLPEHRKQVVEACLREGVFPIGMEHLPAQDATGIQVSLEMVDHADIYIGIYAWRYGWVPDFNNPDKISITEMEFNRALERKQQDKLKEILIFVMHEDHPIRARDKEDGADAQAKLKKFKDGASAGRVRLTFSSPEELRGHVIQSLADAKPRIESASENTPRTPALHPPNLIPKAPEPYIAHPYLLLQTKNVIGRQPELNLLTDWVTTNKIVPPEIRIFNVVAIGGMGKSALTWKWFNDIAPNELPNLAGRMWWSFYESDAHWENFVIRALAYVSAESEKTVRQISAPERENQLWTILDQKPFLLILDGLERILLAYARMDAAQMLDDDLDQKTANTIAETHGLPDNVKETYSDKHRLRQCTDPNAGRFLRRLISLNASRILITTRLYPAELQTVTGQPRHGSFPVFLTGLKDDDAISLWREFGVSGSRKQLVKLFNTFGNYPLLIRALAGEIAEYKPAPGDFACWIADNPDFNPSELDLTNAKSHVLKYALSSLHDEQRKVLHTIAAFRMPASWETLRSILINNRRTLKQRESLRLNACANDQFLDVILTELEDRGLVGWDKQANRYDLHPIVRSVVWNTLGRRSKKNLFEKLQNYFSALPPADGLSINSFDDLAPAIELYWALLGTERYEEAYNIFETHLHSAIDYRLNASRRCIELLNPLIALKTEDLARFLEPRQLSDLFITFARAHLYSGALGCAAHYLECSISLGRQSPLLSGPDFFSFSDLSNALRQSGNLFESRKVGIMAWNASRSWTGSAVIRCAGRLGLVFSASGVFIRAAIFLRLALRMAMKLREDQGRGFVLTALAQHELWKGNAVEALAWATEGNKLTKILRFERDQIRLLRVHGSALIRIEQNNSGYERLQSSLARSRAVDFVEEELPTLIALAEHHRRKNETSTARELLDQVWDTAKRGPYPIFHADALNVLAQIERDAGNRDAAVVAAMQAYTLAWCDGILGKSKMCYAYHYGLTEARKHLQELGAPVPKLGPFDESKFELLPDVELNPEDEFWVDPALDSQI